MRRNMTDQFMIDERQRNQMNAQRSGHPQLNNYLDHRRNSHQAQEHRQTQQRPIIPQPSQQMHQTQNVPTHFQSLHQAEHMQQQYLARPHQPQDSSYTYQ